MGLRIKTCDIASTLDVTTTGIQLALKRENDIDIGSFDRIYIVMESTKVL